MFFKNVERACGLFVMSLGPEKNELISSQPSHLENLTQIRMHFSGVTSGTKRV